LSKFVFSEESFSNFGFYLENLSFNLPSQTNPSLLLLSFLSKKNMSEPSKFSDLLQQIIFFWVSGRILLSAIRLKVFKENWKNPFNKVVTKIHFKLRKLFNSETTPSKSLIRDGSCHRSHKKACRNQGLLDD